MAAPGTGMRRQLEVRARLVAAARRINWGLLAITVAGTHRGSQLADNVCGGGNVFCQLAGIFEDCDTATYWIRSADDC